MNAYKGGDGTSLENAIIMTSKSQGVAVRKEYEYIKQYYDNCHEGYTIDCQSFKRVGEKVYDIIEVTKGDNTMREFWFDITASMSLKF